MVRPAGEVNGGYSLAAIFGLADFGRPAKRSPKRVLRHMAEVHGRQAATRLLAYSDGWAGIGMLPPRFGAPQPRREHIFVDDRIAVLFAGRLLNRASVAAASRIPVELAHEMADPELLGRAFECRGPALFEELEGHYRLAVWDFVTRRMVIANDRFGMAPIFYFQSGEQIFFGSEVKFILRALDRLPPLHPQAIGDFLAFGQILTGNTFFQGIQLLAPEHYLEISEERVQQTPFLQPLAYSEKAEHAEAKEICGHLRNTAMTAVRAFSGQVPTVALSGGVASRFLAAAHHRLHAGLHTITVGKERSAAAEIAREVALHLRSEHHTISWSGADYLAAFQRSVWLSDGMLDSGAMPLTAAAPALREEGQLLALGINPIATPLLRVELPLLRRRKWDDRLRLWLARRLFRQVYEKDDPYLPAGRLLREEIFGEPVAPAARLQEMLPSFELMQIDPLRGLHAMQMKIVFPQRHALLLNALDRFAPTVAPYFTFQFIETLMRLPADWLTRDNILLRQILLELDPALASIPQDDTMLPLSSSVREDFFWRVLRFFNDHFRLYRGRSAENSPLRREPAFPFEQELREKPAFRKSVQRILFDLLPDELLNRYTVQVLYHWMVHHGVQVGEILRRVMAVNLWYRYFVMKEAPFDIYVKDFVEEQAIND